MKRILLTLLLSASAWLSVGAVDFMDTNPCENLFRLGVRMGVNTTNRTVDVVGYNRQNWGTGFDAGIVADLNIREYIAIQPGVFFQSRSGSYTFISRSNQISSPDHYLIQAGHHRSYNVSIPVMVSMRFNLSETLRWQVEAGPYFSVVMGSKYWNDELLSTGEKLEYKPYFTQKPATLDFGLKFGTGMEIADHYYLGVHYMAGLTKAYKNGWVEDNFLQVFGGHTKGWTFTIGYNF